MVKDNFSYSARWETVGLDCCFCINFCGPATWPDVGRVSNCRLHKISLAIEIGVHGYKQGEWFCKQYTDVGKAYPPALKEFETMKPQLKERILYRAAYGETENLIEVRFSDTGLKPV
jgi:hypothetical protein